MAQAYLPCGVLLLHVQFAHTICIVYTLFCAECSASIDMLTLQIAQYALCMLYVLYRVLCMEWIDGVKLTDKPKMDAAGLDIIDFVDIGIECTLRQLLEHGYFHADPHPGKLN